MKIILTFSNTRINLNISVYETLIKIEETLIQDNVRHPLKPCFHSLPHPPTHVICCPGECDPATEFTCRDNGQCIPIDSKCNSIPDCNDFSDEDPDECRKYHCIIVSLYHCIIVSLYHCIIVPLCHCIIVSLCHCIIVSLYHCVIVSLYHCIIVSFSLHHILGSLCGQIEFLSPSLTLIRKKNDRDNKFVKARL